MKAVILFNNSFQSGRELSCNTRIVHELIDTGQYDYAIVLYFAFDYLSQNPKLIEYRLTKLNGEDKNEFGFRNDATVDDNHSAANHLKEMLFLKSINDFEVTPAKNEFITFLIDRLELTQVGVGPNGLFIFRKL